MALPYIFLGGQSMIDKERVKILYLQGYDAVEIAKLLRANKEAVRKCIQRNYFLLKEKHLEAKGYRREILKATSKESNAYISNRSFILKNRSIYRTKLNGDIVLKKEHRHNVTWDTPRILPNIN